MNTINMKNILFLVLAGLFIISCGEDEYNPYSPENISDNDGSVTYTNSTSYPIIGNIVSEEPTFTVDGAYKFKVNTVEAPAGSTFNLSKFSADILTGAITYENSGELSPGNYLVTVGLANVYGMAVYNNAYTLTVLEVPVEATIDNPVVDAGIFQTGVVATVSYTDTSGSGLITSVEYALVDATTGFSIDKDSGEISKSNPTNPGENKLSVKITTNLGAVTISDVCTVTVGNAPTIQYVQADNTTPLNNVLLSPVTAYTTTNPIMDGMNAVSYEIILPETITAGGIVVDNNGSISVLSDQNIPVGVHSIGVIATNIAGISVTFNDQFTLTVTELPGSWSQVYFNDFNSGPTDVGEVVDPVFLHSYAMGTTTEMIKRADLGGTRDLHAMRLNISGPNKTQSFDAVLTLKLTMNPAWEEMRVSFNEIFGFGGKTIATYERSLDFSHNITDLEAGEFNKDGQQQTIMSNTDPAWSGSPMTKTSTDADMNQIIGKNVPFVPSSEFTYLNWRLFKTGPDQAGQLLVDNIKVEVFEKEQPPAPVEE